MNLLRRYPKLLLVLGVLCLFSPLLEFLITNDSYIYDLIRSLVVSEAGVVIFLYILSFIRVTSSLYVMLKIKKYRWDSVSLQISTGRIFRYIGTIILLIEETIRVGYRFGERVFNPRTPLLQLSLIFLFLAWAWLDFRMMKENSLYVTINKSGEAIIEESDRKTQG